MIIKFLNRSKSLKTTEDTKCLETIDGSISIPPKFEPQCVSHRNENLGVENEDGIMANQEKT